MPAAKSEQAYAYLKERITGGGYGPGYRLVLGAIGRELGISPVPVREAIRRLEAEGYVVYERNVGPRVAAVDAGAYAHSMEVLALLEGACTAAAAPLLTPADLDRAADLNDRMAATLTDFDPIGFTRLNQEFHHVLCARGPNPHLRGLVEREWARLDLIRRSTFSVIPGRTPGSIAEHAHLLDLIRTGAPPEEIERCAREHKLTTLNAFLERS